MRLILIGPPGVGKGTQGARLSQKLSVPSVSTGGLLRRLIASGGDTPLVTQARAIEQGAFVSDDFANRLAFSELTKPQMRAGFILDGFPRSLPQAIALDGFLNDIDQALDAAIVFSITATELAVRLQGRRVCGSCGATFHLIAAPPVLEGVCDRCGGNLVLRVEDDQPEKIKLRQQLFESQTMPLISYYQSQGLVHSVSGEGTPDDIFDCICEVLSALV